MRQSEDDVEGKRVVFPSGIATGSGLTMQSWIRHQEQSVASADGDQLRRSGRL